MEQEQRFKAWAILELFGHKVMAGEVSEANIAGGVMIQINVPEVPAVPADPNYEYSRAQPFIPAFTKFFSPSAIYGITPTTEESARATAIRMRAPPIDAFDITAIVKQMSADNHGKRLGYVPEHDGDDDHS